MPAVESVNRPARSNQIWPAVAAGQVSPVGTALFDTSTWDNASVAGPVCHVVTSLPLTSKPIWPLVSVMVPEKDGFSVRPWTGEKAGVLFVASTVNDQFFRSLMAPVTPTVKAAGLEPSTADPVNDRPVAVERVTLLPDLTVSLPGATTPSAANAPVREATAFPPL